MNDVLAKVDMREGWFVVWTESRAEKKVAARLADMGIEQWLPTVTHRRRWSDRWRNVVIPLFPGYLFARGGISQISRLLRTPGVLTVVKSGGRPVFLASEFIATIRHAIELPGAAPESVTASETEFSAGDEVVVREGPLAGAYGVVQEQRGGRKLLIWIREIGRGVAFSIGSAMVQPRSPSAGNS